MYPPMEDSSGFSQALVAFTNELEAIVSQPPAPNGSSQPLNSEPFSLSDIENLPPLPQNVGQSGNNVDPLVFTYSEPVINVLPSISTTSSFAFATTENLPSFLNPDDIPNPFAVQEIQDQMVHRESAGLLIRQVDLSEPVSPLNIMGKLSSDWRGIKEDVTVEELGNSWILFTFATKEARDKVWESRPYQVQGKLLVALLYERLFDPFSFGLLRVDMWVRIPFLPFYLQKAPALSMIIEGNKAGIFIKADVSSMVKNKMKFARLCMNTNFPHPPKFVHIRTCDATILSFELWYEGFSPGCGCCGGPDHLFDECFLHNLTPITYTFAPAGNDMAAENARVTKLKMLQEMMRTHTVSPRVQKGPNFVKKSAKSMAQKQLEAFKGNSASPSSSTAVILAPLSTGDQFSPVVPNQYSPDSGHAISTVGYTPDTISNMHQLAMLMNNPLFKQMHQFPGVTASPTVSPVYEGASNSKVARKLGKMEIHETEEISSDDHSKRGKEKMDESTPPSSKKRKSSRSKALKIKD